MTEVDGDFSELTSSCCTNSGRNWERSLPVMLLSYAYKASSCCLFSSEKETILCWRCAETRAESNKVSLQAGTIYL